jgi:replicative DNA helicase
MWKRKFNIKIAIVDYLQLLSDNTVRQSWAGNRLYIKKIKRIGKRARFHTIAYLSYPRWKHVVLVKRPMLSDFTWESGAIEQDADMVCFIYRPEYYNIEADDDHGRWVRIEIILRSIEVVLQEQQ